MFTQEPERRRRFQLLRFCLLETTTTNKNLFTGAGTCCQNSSELKNWLSFVDLYQVKVYIEVVTEKWEVIKESGNNINSNQ